MTNKELIKAVRICTNGGNCENCPSNANAEHDCIDVVLQGLADALEQATKELDASTAGAKKNCLSCKHWAEQGNGIHCGNCNDSFSNWEWEWAGRPKQQ